MLRQIAAPAATAIIPIYINGDIGSRISDNHIWSQTLTEDPVINLLLEIVAIPAMTQLQQIVQSLYSLACHVKRRSPTYETHIVRIEA